LWYNSGYVMPDQDGWNSRLESQPSKEVVSDDEQPKKLGLRDRILHFTWYGR